MELENVEVKLKLSKLKPLQEGKSLKLAEIINSGWMASGIKDVVDLGSEKLPSIDPFKEFDLMTADSKDVGCHVQYLLAEVQDFFFVWRWAGDRGDFAIFENKLV